MNGIEFLLDTNFILGLLTSHPDVLDAVQSRTLRTSQAAYSVITRMELLGFQGMSPAEESRIRQVLGELTCIPLSDAVETRAIELRRSLKIKLPDAIIAATALEAGLELLTLDQGLAKVVRSASTARRPGS